MSTSLTPLNCHVRYRPIRIGWLVSPSLGELERVFANSHALWGGIHNPILSANSPMEADKTAETFGVDILALPSTAPVSDSKLRSEKFLPWPFFGGSILSPDSDVSHILDIRHPARRFQEARRQHLVDTSIPLYDVTWDDEDPLRFVFSAMFGSFPSTTETRIPYREHASPRLGASCVRLAPKEQIPPDLFGLTVPAFLSAWEVMVLRETSHPALFVGDAQSVDDLIAFWNLRARGISVLFFDPVHRQRMAPLVEGFVRQLRTLHMERGVHWDGVMTAYSLRPILREDIPDLTECVQWTLITSLPAERAPHPEFGSVFTLASLSEGGRGVQATVPLTKKPHLDDDWFHAQHLVASLQFSASRQHEDLTFQPPFVPALNQRYGRDYYFQYNHARSEPTSIGIIVAATDDRVTVNALENDKAIQWLFQTCGLHAEVSQAGRITRRLVQQMGGLQKCRVFKIPGVRQLIRDHAGVKGFSRKAAFQTIQQVVGGKPTFSAHEGLYIEPRPGQDKLTYKDVFTYLLKKDVFRAGIDVRCPRCELTEWFLLDDLKTHVECGLCGHRYNVLPLLQRPDWKFQPSGLFNRFPRQEGAIPVAVLLQQLDADFRENLSAYSMSTKLKWKTGQECEVDFVWVVGMEDAHPLIAIGECKDQGNVDEEDMKKLGALASSLREHNFDVVVLIAKLCNFSQAEAAFCRSLQPPALRPCVVMLSGHELETWGIWPAEQPKSGQYLVGFERLAAITARKYFGESD